MFRRPGAGRSQASADTLCQKCLKRGHYSYECKASAQERPYKSRPSRTQQLLNPKLKPKLTTEVPEDLLRKKGVADDILKKKEEDRKRARSLSISSADSVSTISTNRSRSRSCSRSPPRRTHDGPRHRANDDKAPRKRSRRSVSMDSRSSRASPVAGRNTRRRMSSFSPGERGRRRTRSRSRSRSARMHTSHENARGRVLRGMHGSVRSRSRSARRERTRPARPYSVLRSPSRSADPMDISDERYPPNGALRDKTRVSHAENREPPSSVSPFYSTHPRSPSPYSRRKVARRSRSPHEAKDRGRVRDSPHRPARNRFDDRSPVSNTRVAPPPPAQVSPPVQRERSLSPYSKRLALTKAMQSG